MIPLAGPAEIQSQAGLSTYPGATAGRRRTVRLQLRDATADVHEALHRHPAFVSLLEGRIALPTYRALLARLHGFHTALERDLRDASPEILRGFDVRALERSPDLRADLLALGLSDRDIEALPVCEGLRSVRSNAELMGRLYVVEGSALGGRVLAARLDGLLGPAGTAGRRFFTGRAAPDPLPWPAFCRLLEAQAADVEAMIEGADTTFHALADWLAGSDAHG